MCRERQARAEGSYRSPRTRKPPGDLHPSALTKLSASVTDWTRPSITSTFVCVTFFPPLRFGHTSMESCTISCIFLLWDRKPKKWWDSKNNFTCMEETDIVRMELGLSCLRNIFATLIKKLILTMAARFCCAFSRSWIEGFVYVNILFNILSDTVKLTFGSSDGSCCSKDRLHCHCTSVCCHL